MALLVVSGGWAVVLLLLLSLLQMLNDYSSSLSLNGTQISHHDV